jgi:hypothetical protein
MARLTATTCCSGQPDQLGARREKLVEPLAGQAAQQRLADGGAVRGQPSAHRGHEAHRVDAVDLDDVDHLVPIEDTGLDGLPRVGGQPLCHAPSRLRQVQRTQVDAAPLAVESRRTNGGDEQKMWCRVAVRAPSGLI